MDNKSSERNRPELASHGEYLQWKDWGRSSFGIYRPVDAAYFSAELKRARKSFSPSSKVLEIGFGNGLFMKFAADKGWQIIGTELNPALIEVASSRGFNVMQCADLRQFPSESFDLVVAFDVLEHLPNHLLSEMILDVHRVLKRGGVFLARFPNGDSPLGLAYQNGDVTHLSSIGSLKIAYLARGAGMDIVWVGPEAQPILCGSVPHFFHRLFAIPVRWVLDGIVRLLFFPSLKVSFMSPNISVVLRRLDG